MKKTLVIAVIAGVIWLLFFKTPSSRTISAEMRIDPRGGAITYDQDVYHADWSDPTSFSGDLRYIGRAYNKYIPVITHDAIVTTGEFSDPDIVTIGPVRDGNTYWRAHKQPEGTFVMLHLIPSSVAIHDQLEELSEGDAVLLVGKVEEDGTVLRPDGSFVVKLMHDNHKFLLVTEVK